MDPSEFNLPQSLPPPSLVSEVVWSHHPMENPPQNQQYEKEQLELEQPEPELNVTPEPLPPTSPSGLLKQNLAPWSLPPTSPTRPPSWLWTWKQSEQGQEIQWVGPQQFDSVEWWKEQSQVELNLTPGPPPLPMPPVGLLEQTPPRSPRQTPPWLWTWQQSEQEQDLLLQNYEPIFGDKGEEVGVVGTGEVETELDKLNSGCLGHEKSKENTPGGESGNNKTIDVGIASPLGDVLQTEGMDLNEGFPQLNSDTLASDQVAAVTVDTNKPQLSPTAKQENQDEDFGIDEVEIVEMCLKGASKDLNASAVAIDANRVVAKDIPPPQFSATAQQDNPDEDFGNDELGEVEINLESGRIAEPQFESRCFVKRKRTEKTPGEERRNKKTGVRIGTPSEDSLQTKGVSPKDNAKHLKGGPSRNTSGGGHAGSNVDVNTAGGQASSEKRLTSFSGKRGLKIAEPSNDRVFRSSLRGIMKLIKELNLRTCHKEVLKRTPFWGMFEAIIDNKLSPTQCRQRGKMIIEIINTYDPVTGKFRLGRQYMELTRADVVSMFGISCGNKFVDLKYCRKEKVKFVKRWDISKSRLTSKLLKELLKKYVGSDEKDDVEDIARLLCVYLCHTFFFPTGTTVKWVYLERIEDLDRLQDYDWNEAIINELISSIRKHHREPRKVTGCVMALMYWLCERTNLSQADSEHPLGIVKWNIQVLESKLKKIWFNDLKPHQVVSREAKVARTTDDEVPVMQDSVLLGDVAVSNRGNDACSGNGKRDEKTQGREREQHTNPRTTRENGGTSDPVKNVPPLNKVTDERSSCEDRNWCHLKNKSGSGTAAKDNVLLNDEYFADVLSSSQPIDASQIVLQEDDIVHNSKDENFILIDKQQSTSGESVPGPPGFDLVVRQKEISAFGVVHLPPPSNPPMSGQVAPSTATMFDIGSTILRAQLPSSRPQLQEIYDELSKLQLDYTPLRTKIEKYIQNVTNYGSMKIGFASGMTEEEKERRLADVNQRLTDAQALNGQAKQHAQTFRFELSGIDAERAKLKRELKLLDLKAKKLRKSIDGVDAERVRKEHAISTLQAERATIEAAEVIKPSYMEVANNLEYFSSSSRKKSKI